MENPEAFLYPALVVAAMFIGALNAKALAVVLSFVIGLAIVYPSLEGALFMAIFLMPAAVAAQFRD